MPTKSAKSPAVTKARAARMSLAEAMSALEKAGTAQARKIYARYGAQGPMFGVSFAFLKTLVRRIGVDQELALALWDTGNFDARLLAAKVADPQGIKASDLDRWARVLPARMCGSYLAALVAEGPHARAKAEKWLGGNREPEQCLAWAVVGATAMV